MTKKQINDQFNQYQLLLHKLSHQCSNRCGRPEDEVYGQACYLFMQATEHFKPSRGKFGSFLFSFVRNGLGQWGMKNELAPNPTNTPEQVTIRTPVNNAVFNEWLAGLKDEVREVAMIILNGPAEVLDLSAGMGRKAVVGALNRYLRQTKGWSFPKIWRTVREMKRQMSLLNGGETI